MLKPMTEEFVVTAKLAEKIDAVLAANEYDRTKIVGILLDVQDIIENHYIPQPVAFYIAQKLPIPVSVIYDCLKFYAALSDKPRAKYPIEVCQSVACKVNAADNTYEYLKELLGIDFGETTYDGRFTLEKVMCFGACDIAPAIRIDGKIFGNLDTKEKVADVLRQFA